MSKDSTRLNNPGIGAPAIYAQIGIPRAQKIYCMNHAHLIPHIASMIGIDPLREPEYLWIAEAALKATVDSSEWSEFNNSKGEVLYCNMKLNVCLISEHNYLSESAIRPSSYLALLANFPSATWIWFNCNRIVADE
jgi:hypothetical protein